MLDEEPRIFSDPFALGLSGLGSEAVLTARLDDFVATLTAHVGRDCAEETFRYLRAGMTVRSRYTEDELSQAVHRGIAQYVMLGAGLDSFAYRRRDLAGHLRVFEGLARDLAKSSPGAQLVASYTPDRRSPPKEGGLYYPSLVLVGEVADWKVIPARPSRS